MSVLNDCQIRLRCEKGMVFPFDLQNINPASLDICIGSRLLIRRRKLTLRGWVGYWEKISLRQTTPTKPYWIKPKTRFLAESLEIFDIPTDLVGQLRLKSSRGRELWEHLEAGFIDPGWHNSKLTMEIVNLDLVSRPLWQGMKFAQIYFLEIDRPARSYAQTGRYNGDRRVQVSKG